MNEQVRVSIGQLQDIRLGNLRANQNRDGLTANGLADLSYVACQGSAEAYRDNRSFEARRFERFARHYTELLTRSPAYQSAAVFIEAERASGLQMQADRFRSPQEMHGVV